MNTQAFPYEVLEEYGRGGCSIIYKIKSLEGHDDKEYVLKTMMGGDEDAQNHQRFYMEYEFLRAYPHPNLIEVREYFKDWHGQPGYVMEWIAGDTWQSYFRDRNLLEDMPVFLHLFRQLCDGLDFIHKHQIVHRDLKPQNILISKDDVVKIIDFGIMKVADLTMYTHRNTFMGSAYYVAPEGVADEQVTHTADIFSLGVILYDMFTGMKPFQGHTLGETIYQRLVKTPQPPSQIAEVPKEIDPIILRCINRDPRQRYNSCTEVYREFEAIFGKMRPVSPAPQVTEVDILTKEPLLHGHFLKNCEAYLQEKSVLYLMSGESGGKTTVIENLASRMAQDSLIKLDCHANSTELGLMEAILRNIHISSTHNKRLAPWRDILAKALPGLQWRVDGEPENISLGTLISAFNKVMSGVKEKTMIAIEDLHAAPASVIQFVGKFAQMVDTRINPKLTLILTTEELVPNLDALGMPIQIEFPDLIALSDYLAVQFDGGQIPIELTQKLIDMSENRLGRLIRTIKQYKHNERLRMVDGVLELVEEAPPLPTPPADVLQNTLPNALTKFTKDEIHHLEWIALCPDGLDLNILKTVTGAGIGDLGATLTKANEFGFLEWQSTVTDGFRWKDEALQHYLVENLSADERINRFLTLADTVEQEAKYYLNHSPPLWLILCRLYQQAADDERASDYGFRYARYCFQNANYEPVRTYLTQFIPLPKYQNNQEFWAMLALSHHEDDIRQALYYGGKALQIEENIHSLALMAILEFEGGDVLQARELVQRLFQAGDFEPLEIHYISLLIPILLTLDEEENAQLLERVMTAKLKGRTDLYATNSLILSRMHLLQTKPVELIHAIGEIDGELLPHTYRKINQWAGIAYQELFQYERALASLRCLDHANMTEPRYFRELLYLYLNFHKITEVKNLISSYRQSLAKSERLRQIEPLFQLITEMLVKDPKIYEFRHVEDTLSQARVDASTWLTLITSTLDPRLIKPDFVRGVLGLLHTVATPWARHKSPRLNILSIVKSGRQMNLTLQVQQAVDIAHAKGLVMEKLRLAMLQESLRNFGHTVARVDYHFPQGFLESPDVFQFTKMSLR